MLFAIIIACICNVISMLYIFRNETTDNNKTQHANRFMNWFYESRAMISLIAGIAIIDLSALNILFSFAFKYNAFNGNLSQNNMLKLKIMSFIINLIENIPQIYIQIIILIQTNGYDMTLVTMIGLIVSMFDVLISIAGCGIFTLIVTQNKQKTNELFQTLADDL